MKKYILLLLSCLTISVAHANPHHLKQELRMGTSPIYAPYEYIDTQGHLKGIDIEIGENICHTLKLKCHWVTLNFDGLVSALKGKMIDMTLSAMSITAKREKVLLFSNPLYQSASLLMIKKGAPPLNVADPTSLKGKRIGVESGTIQAEYAKKVFLPEGAKVLDFMNIALARQDLLLGRLDATFQDGPVAQYFMKSPEGKNFEFSGSEIKSDKNFSNQIAIAFSKDSIDLKEKVNQVLDQMKTNGLYDAILKKYEIYGIEPVDTH